MLDLSATSPDLCDEGGSFPEEPWRDAAEKLVVDNYHVHPELQPFTRVELHALAFPKDAVLALLLEDEMQNFSESPAAALKLPPMIAMHRRLASDCALRHGFEVSSEGPRSARHVVVRKTSADVTSPLLQYADAIPTSMPRDKLFAALGYRRKKIEAPVEYACICGQVVGCRVLTSAEAFSPYKPELQTTDRADWARLVFESVRKGVPVATHAHIVEVRVSRPERDAGQFTELQRFIGPFQVRWLRGDKHSGVGVVVYPSVPAANNCLDRFEDDEEGARPFALYPFAPHVPGPYLDDPSLRRLKAEAGLTTTPVLGARSPATTPGTGPWRPTCRSPVSPSGRSPPVQPLCLGRGKWLEVKQQQQQQQQQQPQPAPGAKHTVEVVLPPQDKQVPQALDDCVRQFDPVALNKTDNHSVSIEFASAEDAACALKAVVDAGWIAKTQDGTSFALEEN